MKSLIVIEDFYADVDSVREFALNKAEYFSPHELSSNFPGTESKKSYCSQGVVKKIEEAIGQKIKVDPRNYSFAVFCKTFAQDQIRRTIHVDQSDWTGLVYLNKPEDCRGGTTFHRHKSTGLDRIPAQSRIEAMGYRDRMDFIDRFVKEEGADFSRWDLSARVAMKTNRMILFRAGEMFHAAEGYFGTDDQNCRLTQLFFFKVEGDL